LVYKIKFNSSGQVGRFKAKLVVKGYSQIEWLDYNDTFFLVVKIISLIVLLVWVATKKLTILHMDVKSASYLCVCVCVFQLEGYINPNKEDLVNKLHKTIYDLTQSSHEWYKRINDYLGSCGFKNNGVDLNIYIKTLGEKFIV
jgi:hypothetical protein